MVKVVEAFSGIGSQHKALTKLKAELGYDFKIINTIEWDINAIFAYDIIHNGPQDLTKYSKMNRNDLLKRLDKYALSLDGSQPLSHAQLRRFSDDALKGLLCSIDRNDNLTSIKEVTSDHFKEDIDIFTYSFPCQDLSLSGYFHGDKGGIARDAENSSSMLWEVERILLDFNKKNKTLPKFLLMENVSSIESSKHIKNFKEWQDQLKELGYSNKVYHLSSENFGVPQRRRRAFMISAFHGNDIKIKNIIEESFENSTLDKTDSNFDSLKAKLSLILKTDYTNEIYYKEAKEQIPNDTPSRIKILEQNPIIINSNGDLMLEKVRTLTTKQDRNPNSGIIKIDQTVLNEDGKSSFRYLTPRESFLLMGFDESDYDRLIANDIDLSTRRNLLTKTKLTKMAGNSIVVDVIKEVFKEIITLKKLIENSMK